MNPCCCMSHRTGSMVVAVLGIIGNSIGVLISIFGIVGAAYAKDHPKVAEEAKLDLARVNSLLIFLIFSLILYMIRLAFSIVLVLGIKKSSVSLVKFWLVAQSVTLVISVCYIIALNVLGHRLAWENSAAIFSSIFTVWFITIVYYFWSELLQTQTNVQI